MESNGQRGKIQVSPATRDLLVAAGKDKWLTAREDLVEAKGKGKMQCYWVQVSNDAFTRVSVVSSQSQSSGDIPVVINPPAPLEEQGYERQVEV
jgi:Adenylate and Guanylate cyclase catalytic domain